MTWLHPIALRGGLGMVCVGSVLHAQPPEWLEVGAQKVQLEVIALRRDFHQNPELSNGEERTARIVAERLRGLGLEVQEGVARHGVIGVLRGGKPGGCVAIRADMDALPIEEVSEMAFRSRQPGVMHACGHDAHTAIALGVAALLAQHREELPGTVKFLFQPAEEGMPVHFAEDWGAKRMIREGALENPSPQAVFALHCAPLVTVVDSSGNRRETALVAGKMGVAPGAISANSDRFQIVVRGKMAHGSAPHRGVDAIQVAAAIVSGLQTIRSRHVNPQEPVVLSVGTIKGGQRENILAEQVEMTGTVRTASVAVQEQVIALMERIIRGVAEAHGATAELTYRKGYPASVNDPALLRQMLPTLEGVLGASNLVAPVPSMGGEDFAYFAQKIPALYLQLGITRPGVEKPAGLHTPEFDLDEAALPTGVRVLTSLIWESLSAKSSVR